MKNLIKHKIKILILFFIIAAGFVCFIKFHNFLNINQIILFRNEILSFITIHQNLSLIIFSFIFLLVSIVFIPGLIAPMSVLSGFIFGKFLGGFITTTLAALGAGIAFLICRYYLLDFVYSKFSHQKKICEFISKNGAASILILRLFPIIPFPFINVLAAISPIKFLEFFIASGVGKIPLAFIYSFTGYEIRNANKFQDILNYKIFSILGVLIVMVLLGNFIKNKI